MSVPLEPIVWFSMGGVVFVVLVVALVHVMRWAIIRRNPEIADRRPPNRTRKRVSQTGSSG